MFEEKKYEVIPTSQFIKDVNYYYKKKKYIKIDKDIKRVTNSLLRGKLIGDPISNMKLEENKRIFKARTENTSMRLGKSNGFRIIYYVIKDTKEIFLLAMYSAKDKESISKNKLLDIIKNLNY